MVWFRNLESCDAKKIESKKFLSNDTKKKINLVRKKIIIDFSLLVPYVRIILLMRYRTGSPYYGK